MAVLRRLCAEGCRYGDGRQSVFGYRGIEERRNHGKCYTAVVHHVEANDRSAWLKNSVFAASCLAPTTTTCANPRRFNSDFACCSNSTPASCHRSLAATQKSSIKAVAPPGSYTGGEGNSRAMRNPTTDKLSTATRDTFRSSANSFSNHGRVEEAEVVAFFQKRGW